MSKLLLVTHIHKYFKIVKSKLYWFITKLLADNFKYKNNSQHRFLKIL